MKFSKPALSIPDQVAKLRSRHLDVPDQTQAEHYLWHIGYYRLSAYALPLQQNSVPDKPFKAGAKFEDILNLYRFDRELRLLAMDAIERIEVSARSVIVNEMCVRHGTHWLTDAKHFHSNFNHNGLLDKIDKELGIPANARRPTRPHHEVFINHYYATYTSPDWPPVWMVGETLTLGTWSIIFENLRQAAERKAIAAHFGVDEQVLRNWLHVLTHVRNLCAHHARLWNRQLVIKVVVAKKHAAFLKVNDRFYAVAVVMHELLQRISPGTGWHGRLWELLQGHPYVDGRAMGFPPNWEKDAFWTPKAATI